MSGFTLGENGLPRWKTTTGATVSCTEKVRVLDDNFKELRELAQEALDDAVLMGCPAKDVLDTMISMLSELQSQYPDQSEGKENEKL